MGYRFYFCMLIALSLFSGAANARQQGYAIDFLNGESSTQGVRLAYRPYVNQVAEIPVLGKVDMYWELSVNFWVFNQESFSYIFPNIWRKPFFLLKYSIEIVPIKK